MEPDLDDIIGRFEMLDIQRLARNVQTRTANLQASLEWEKEHYRDLYNDMESRLTTVPHETLAQDLVNFDRFEWKMDWVKVLQATAYSDKILRAMCECRHVKMDGDTMLNVFGNRSDLTDVFVQTFKRGFYALDQNTRGIHFAQLPSSMYTAVVTSENVNFTSELDEILESPLVSDDNKILTMEYFAEGWMCSEACHKRGIKTAIEEFLVTSVSMMASDHEFCAALCKATTLMFDDGVYGSDAQSMKATPLAP